MQTVRLRENDFLRGEQIPPTVNLSGDETYARPRIFCERGEHVNKCAKQ